MATQIDPLGFIVKAAKDKVVGRTLTAGPGIKVTNGNGASGNPTVELSGGQSVSAQTGTTYTLTKADRGNLVTLNDAGGTTVTVTSAPGGTFVDLLVLGVGAVTVVGASGLVLVGRGTTSAFRYARLRLQWEHSNRVWVTGDVTPA